jgi:hypothetical protein
MYRKISPIHILVAIAIIGLAYGGRTAYESIIDTSTVFDRQFVRGLIIFIVSFIILERLYLRSTSRKKANKTTNDPEKNPIRNNATRTNRRRQAKLKIANHENFRRTHHQNLPRPTTRRHTIPKIGEPTHHRSKTQRMGQPNISPRRQNVSPTPQR